MKKGIKFRDFAFSTSVSLNLLKFLDKQEQQCVKSSQINVISQLKKQNRT